ncbi:MAG: DUF4442 domain-containing protein [Pseudomonadota bacterium]
MIDDKQQMYTMIKSFFDESVPYAKHSGIQLIEIAEGHGSAELPDWKDTQNHMGTQHAGALFTVGEAASGAASVFLFADKIMMVKAAISSATIDYVRGARGVIRAFGKLRGSGDDILAEFSTEGRVKYIVDVSLMDSKEREVATMEVHWSVQINQPSAG